MNVIPDFKINARLIKEFEGFENKAYQDTGGVWTLGFGFTYNYGENRKVKENDFIDWDTAVMWLGIALDKFTLQANSVIHVPLTPEQSSAVVDYIYNRGIGNFMKTRLDELINANPEDPEILKEIIGTGLKDRLGNLLWGLGRRRLSQAYLYKYGKLKFSFNRWQKEI